MRFIYLFSAFAFLQIARVYSTGQFYIGSLGYHNDNITTLCCENSTCGTGRQCSFLFEIQVDLFNSSNGPESRRPTKIPLTATQVELFQVDDKIISPIAFQFNKWPGGADMSVLVLDGETEAILDQFNYTVELYSPMDYYRQVKLTGETFSNSSLTIIYRYACNPTKGPPCFTDCVDHAENETCPPTPPTGTQIPTDVITFTGFNDRKCETTDANGTIVSFNCSTGSTPTTLSMTNKTISTSPSTTSSTSQQINTTSQPVSTTVEASSPSPSTTSSTESSTKSKTEKTSSSTMHITSNPYDPGSDVTTQTTTTPNQGVSTIDNDPVAYWPGIVGGVLGGVALIAASAFICYWNRQKKLQKRQEIYNVNPKILRNFEEFEENGTSGRADVPMETEQY